MKNKIENGIEVSRASMLAGVELRKLQALIRTRTIFARRDADGEYFVSPAVIEDLPSLVAGHFSARGEYLANRPTIGTYRSKRVDEIEESHFVGMK